jgi:hypothetical protein
MELKKITVSYSEINVVNNFLFKHEKINVFDRPKKVIIIINKSINLKE